MNSSLSATVCCLSLIRKATPAMMRGKMEVHRNSNFGEVYCRRDPLKYADIIPPTEDELQQRLCKSAPAEDGCGSEAALFD